MDFTVSMLETGMRYEGFLLVRSADQREGKTGGKYLDMNLTDKTGDLAALLLVHPAEDILLILYLK